MREIIVLALLGSTFAVPKSISRIVNGTPIDVETYPFMSNIQIIDYGIWWTPQCGGTLLTTTAVLSAAQCYHGHEDWVFRVVLGSSYLQAGGTAHSIQQIIRHPEYNDATMNNDVAVIRLAIPAKYSSTIGNASIAGPYYTVSVGAIVTYVGWGRLWDQGPTSPILRHVNVNVINHNLCVERYAFLRSLPGFEHWPTVESSMICAGILDQGGKDACDGDAGGPLLQGGNIVVGIISWAYKCGDPFYPGVNTRVSTHSNWIVASATS